MPSPRAGLLAATLRSVSMAAAAPRFVECRDAVAKISSLTSKQWLVEQASGAYTTARTCAGARRLFEWDMHVSRTASSAAAMLNDPSGSAPAPSGELSALMAAVGDAASLRPRLDATVGAAVREHLSGDSGATGELKVTILVTWDAGGSSVACHVSPLPPLPSSPVKVEVRGAPRSNAAAKDSAWVSERAPLEALMRPDFNELLLVTADGALLEGSQTNFFALVDGALHTAGEGVLAGTVRRLLLEVCEREGVPVVLSPPRLADAARWEGCFVSSTSRLLLPIDELYVPKEGAPSADGDRVAAWDNAPGGLAARLRDLVQGEVEAHSTPIVGR